MLAFPQKLGGFIARKKRKQKQILDFKISAEDSLDAWFCIWPNHIIFNELQ